MNKKIVIVLEILFIIIAICYYTIKEIIPDYKEMFGSSDKLLNPEKCSNVIELRIDDKIDYIYLLDKSGNIYHLIFFNESSLVLYNKNIENNTIDNGLEKSIKLLIENNYLKSNYNIYIDRYDDKYYDNFISSFKKVLSKYSVTSNIVEEKNDFKEKAIKLNLDSTSINTIISDMDYYSKELINNSKDNSDIILSDDTSIKLANNVYRKIEKYVSKNNIDNLEKDNTVLIINTIPADDNNKYYPSINSWYYVKNKKIYAYIELEEKNKKYGYCYNGSIDDVHEGECG